MADVATPFAPSSVSQRSSVETGQLRSLGSEEDVGAAWKRQLDVHGAASVASTLLATALVGALTFVPASQSQDLVDRSETKMTARHAEPSTSQIGDLPRMRLSTRFEPHFRQAAVERMTSLVAQFRQSIGNPEAAVVEAELRAFLSKTYRQSALNSETRNFATAVSLLQDFLRPHWSEISVDKLTDISGRLVWLNSQTELSPRIVESFYNSLVSVVGSKISISVGPDDENVEESSEEFD